ncbi:hypothetical protein [Yersinia kristensenii]|uniref:hypothetical protein n=1 Tax=Yersinia kristensenii TaxID=28152 RepID=UPI001FE04F95|nr:hypothetical protein [Yersinia kristensenii]
MSWSLESVSLRPHSIPYDFGFMTTRRRFSQVIRIILIPETLATVIDSEFTWGKLRQEGDSCKLLGHGIRKGNEEGGRYIALVEKCILIAPK